MKSSGWFSKLFLRSVYFPWSSTFGPGFNPFYKIFLHLFVLHFSDSQLSLPKLLAEIRSTKRVHYSDSDQEFVCTRNLWYSREWQVISLKPNSQISGCTFKSWRACDCMLARLLLILVEEGSEASLNFNFVSKLCNWYQFVSCKNCGKWCFAGFHFQLRKHDQNAQFTIYAIFKPSVRCRLEACFVGE